MDNSSRCHHKISLVVHKVIEKSRFIDGENYYACMSRKAQSLFSFNMSINFVIYAPVTRNLILQKKNILPILTKTFKCMYVHKTNYIQHIKKIEAVFVY